jgi:hypothetical protein
LLAAKEWPNVKFKKLSLIKANKKKVESQKNSQSPVTGLAVFNEGWKAR